VDAGLLPEDRELIEDLEGAEFDVQDHRLIQRSGGLAVGM
jgi:hypothetical protein